MQHPTIVWFRRDLRVVDNPALVDAISRGMPIIPVFIWSPEDECDWPPGTASRWWMHHSLQSLDNDLKKLGSRLILRQGNSMDELQNLIIETGAEALYWNRRYEPSLVARGADIKSEFLSQRIEVKSFNGSLLYEPWGVLNNQEKPIKLFHDFWKACIDLPEPSTPLSSPREIIAPVEWPKSVLIEQLDLLAEIDRVSGFHTAWTPGVKAAWEQLDRLLEETLAHYKEDHDHPDHQGVSRLSPHLNFGEISPRQILHAVLDYIQPNKKGAKNAWAFLRQLGRREFSHHLLFHYPFLADQPMDSAFSNFPWVSDDQLFNAWREGRTGYPFVDAGMRELWHTGWINNRVRMTVASFLVKDLLIPWKQGAQWFWETLVDANLANNAMGWQWVAGCCADASPYYHIFNPVIQGERFDPDGNYVRHWIPELAYVPNDWVHKPWEAPPLMLTEANVELGTNYPDRIVDHAIARKSALDSYEAISKDN